MIELIEKRLDTLVSRRQETLFEAVRYSLLSKGKRLRPLLMLKAAEEFGTDPLFLLDVACAIEMIHTYSLIHDDLPCMDDDALRRGMPTLHKVYGEAVALLAGDYLLNYAYEVIAKTSSLDVEQRLKMIQSIATHAGAPGLIGGQVIDIESQEKNIDEKTLLEMHKGKTASLFIACLECASLSAKIPPSSLLQEIGVKIGLIFQMQDDLLDALSSTAVLGKNVGADAKKKKPTAISLYGVEKTQKKLQELETSLYLLIDQLPKKGIALHPLLGQILKRTQGTYPDRIRRKILSR